MSTDENEQNTEEIPEFDLAFKIIVLGDSGVGKSCLTIQATKGVFDSIYAPTIGFEFLTFTVKVNDKNIKLQIWDTCGQEVYRSLISSFYRNSSLAILVYSIENKESFSNLELWLNELKSQGNIDMTIFLVGNKADLQEERKVSIDEGKKFSDENGIKYFFETSAKTGLNAKKVFTEAAKILYDHHLKIKDLASRPESIETLNLDRNNQDNSDNNRRKKNKCC